MAKLKSLGIRAASKNLAEYFNSFATPQEFYINCYRGDYLLWVFANTNPGDIRLLTSAKGHCANTIRHLMTDKRSIAAVDAAIAFGDGKITVEELRIAAEAAFHATDAMYNAVVNSLTNIRAAEAAYNAAANNVDDVKKRAWQAYDAVNYTIFAPDTPIMESKQITADICRKHLPLEYWDF